MSVYLKGIGDVLHTTILPDLFISMIVQMMYRKMASLRYIFIAITLWCIGLDVKLIIYKPSLERNLRGPLAVLDKSLEMRSKVNYDVVRDRNKQRMQHLRKSCKELGILKQVSEEGRSFSAISNLRAHITPHLDVMFCRVNKCGSTLALEIMRRVFNCDTECLVETAKNVKADPQMAYQVMKAAFSFLIVREPYGRLFSSYSNLFYLPKEDWLTRAVKIIKQVRPNATKASLSFGHDLTFLELIKYVVINYERGSYIDPHVRPMHHFSCNPCSYRFDYLAKIETLTSDLEYILHEWHEEKKIPDYHVNTLAEVKEWTVWGPVKHALNTVNLTRNSTIPLKDMFTRTWTYYQMKGLVSKKIELPFRDSELWNIDFSIMQRVLGNAIKISEDDMKAVHHQRTEALLQAYATIPMELMERLRKVVKDDCILFGYDERPAYLFNRTNTIVNNSNFDYFKSL